MSPSVVAAAGKPVVGLMRKLRPVSVVMRMRSTVGLKSMP